MAPRVGAHMAEVRSPGAALVVASHGYDERERRLYRVAIFAQTANGWERLALMDGTRIPALLTGAVSILRARIAQARADVVRSADAFGMPRATP